MSIDAERKKKKKRYAQRISNKFGYSSFTQLEDGLYDILKEVQRMTLDDLENKLYEFIEEEIYSKNVYAVDNDGWFYKRTGSMYNIWEQTTPYIRYGVVYGDIRPTNYQGMVYNKDELQHMSPFGTKLTPQDYVKLINDGVSMEHSIFGEISPRPFWDKFLKWANENYTKIFSNHLKEMGIDIRGYVI